MFHSRMTHWALIFAMSGFFAATVSAGEVVGSFTRIAGSVDVLRAGDITAMPVRVGEPVAMGDAVRTKRGGKAEIQFKDETVIQLAPETRIVIDEYSFRGNERERGLLSLLRGKVRAIVSKVRAAVVPVSRTGAGFSIKTPTAIAGVKGTDLLVFFERGITGVFFLDGFGFVVNPQRLDRVIQMRRGFATFVLKGDQPPLDAQPVSSGYIAPLLSDTGANGEAADSTQNGGEGTAADTTGGGTTGTTGGTAGDAAGPAVNVVADNTGYATLADPSAFNAILTTASVPQIVAAEQGELTSGPTRGTTTLIPITESNPSTLNMTPVTVNVRIP